MNNIPDPNCPTCKGTGQDTTITGFTSYCDCVVGPDADTPVEQYNAAERSGIDKGEKYDVGDGLLLEMESGKEDQDVLWAEVLKFGNSIYTNKEWFDTMKSRYTITRKQH